MQLIEIANTISTLPYQDGAKLIKNYIKQYGPTEAVKIARLAELYLKTKRGEIERDEAVKRQNEILNGTEDLK